MDGHRYRRNAYFESLANVRQRFALTSGYPYLSYVGRSQSIAVPFLNHHVAHVVRTCPKEQMVRADTRRIVAAVKDVQYRIKRAISQSVGDSMRQFEMGVSADVPIAALTFGAHPFPAGRLILHSSHLAPESGWPTLFTSGVETFLTAIFTSAVATLKRFGTSQANASNLWHVGTPLLSRW